MIFVTCPFYLYHVVTLIFDLLQGKICCQEGDHNSSNLLVLLLPLLNLRKTSKSIQFYYCKTLIFRVTLFSIAKDLGYIQETLFSRFFIFIIRPSSDGTYYGMVMSVRPGLRPSVRPSQFSALFSYMLWHIDLKFCVSLYFYARKIKFECHQFPSLFAGVMLLFNFKLLQICSFPHFSPTCFDILLSNFVYDFVLMYHRASLSVVILLQFLLELCLFVNLEYSKYTVFCTFLLHALTYWAEILHMSLFYCTTDQVRVSSICVNFCGSYAPFGT